MQRPLATLSLSLALGLFAGTALAASAPGTVGGTWRTLAPEPVAIPYPSHVWTGSKLILFGRRPLTKTAFNPSVNAALAFDPAANTWKKLAPPAQPGGGLGCCHTVWTGKQMLVFGADLAYDPATDKWSTIRAPLPNGIVVWTGREAIGWGGGCCGDVRSDGAAYNPTTRAYRKLPRSPLAPSQGPIGAWDGHELVLFVSGYDADGKAYPAHFARAAAYDPSTNRWRRLAALPVKGPRFAVAALSLGGRIYVVGAGSRATASFAYDPDSNKWRRLAPLAAPRQGAKAVSTGTHVVLWGGSSPSASHELRAGVSYDPSTNRWSSLPQPPLRAAASTSVEWATHSLLVFAGSIGATAATHNQQVYLRGVAGFTPVRP